MAQANRITTTKLSALFADPFLRSAFERAERDLDTGDCFAVTDHPARLDSGAAELLTGRGTRRVPILEVV
jgi:hypothetical protein